MFSTIRERLSSVSLALRVLVGAFLGILCGLIFGDYCTLLAPVGSAYVMMLQAVVYPYIICLVLLGIAELSREKCLRLFKHSWPFYVAAFGLTLGIMRALGSGLPPAPPPPAIDPSQSIPGSVDLLHLLIPSNIFESLMRDHLPGVIVFAIVFGFAIQGHKGKMSFLVVLQVVRDGCSAINNWILSLSPLGVFAILAKTAGTTETSVLAGLVVYLVLFFGGVVLIVFWLLPSLMAALTPFRYREIMKELKSTLVLSGATALAVVALPLVRHSAQRFADQAGIKGEDRDEVVGTSLSVGYVLAHLGNLAVYFFVLFALERFHVRTSGSQLLLLPFLTAISSVGATSSTFNALAFLQSWLGLPEETSQLYLETFAITRFGQTLLSVAGLGFVTFLSTLSYGGKVRVHLRKLLGCVSGLLIFASLFAALVWGLRGCLQTKMPELHPFFALARDTTHGVNAEIFRSSDSMERDPVQQDDILPGESTLHRIERTKTLRVGYNPQVTPFSYWNSAGELVGYDISYAYDLARALNVKLQLIIFDWKTLIADLEHRRLDIAMSAIYITEERLKTVMVSQPYFQSPAALMVPSRMADRFLSASEIQAMGGLRLAALNAPVSRSFVQRVFPDAEVVSVPSYEEIPRHPEIDAGFSALVLGAVWAESHPGYTAVVPKNLGAVMMFGYLMAPGSDDLARFVNFWLDMRKADGFEKAQTDYWILGKPRPDGKRRWCVIRNVLHWVD
jgi:proton glutamate symport protein